MCYQKGFVEIAQNFKGETSMKNSVQSDMMSIPWV